MVKDSRDNLKKAAYCYVALLFSFYPLIFSPIQGYYAMGNFKFRAWAVMTAVLVGYLLVCAVKTGSVNSVAKLFVGKSGSRLYAVSGVFLILATISFILTPYKLVALVGMPGWFTGLLFQYGLILVLFIVGAYVRMDRWLMWVIMGSAMVVFALGILHRFYIDPIGIMRSLSPEEYVRFLSTIGQATWYSSYLCVVFPVGLYGFVTEAGPSIAERIGAGVFLALSAGTLVTQNSDSAYLGIGVAVLAFLIWAVCKGRKYLMRMGVAIVIMAAAVALMGVVERLAGAGVSSSLDDTARWLSMVPIDELSLRIAQGILPVLGICFGVVIVLLTWNEKVYVRAGRSLVVAGMVAFVAGAGYALVRVIAGAAKDVYFVAGRDWGNGRGLIWLRTMEMFRDLPVVNKLFGVGPGCFNEYISGYTDLVLGNAHNEWLTMMVEVGIVGGVAYLGVFVAAVVMAIRMIRCESRYVLGACGESETRAGSVHVGIIVLAAVLAYMVHNFFNYQQCIAAPMIMAIIGMGLHEIDA